MGIQKIIDKTGNENVFFAKLIAYLEYKLLPLLPGVSSRLDDAIALYLENTEGDTRENKKRICKIKKDILFSRNRYQISIDQYFLFGFERLNDFGRREFVGSHEKSKYTDDISALSATHNLFRNKFCAYQQFREYYGRDVVEIKSEESREAFLVFSAAHPRFIIKETEESKGEGIEIVDLRKSGQSADTFFQSLLSNGKSYIAEELIQQSHEMAALHPSSVNTVRFVTYLKPEGVIHMFSFLRMGAGEGHIDNASAGGLAAAIDMETGIVTTTGWREDLTQYLRHPDSGTQIIGMQIPRWEELLALVDKLAMVVPEQHYVGWDLALTNRGWIMVEGNDAAMMTAIQMCRQRGIRQIFNQTFCSEERRIATTD